MLDNLDDVGMFFVLALSWGHFALDVLPKGHLGGRQVPGLQGSSSVLLA